MALREDSAIGADRLARISAARHRLRPGFWVDVGSVLAVFLAFAAGAVLWESFGSWAGQSFFYPAAGVVAGAMILSRRALWPWMIAAVIAAEVLVDTCYGSPLTLSAGFAAANVAEPVIAASLVRAWCGGRPDLRKRQDFAIFISAACLIAPFYGGLIGGAVLSLLEGTPWQGAAMSWWAGDALGILVIGAPILLWSTQSYIVRQRPWEVVGVLGLTLVLCVVTFWTQLPLSMLVLPVLAWAAFRVDMIGTAMAGAMAAFLANIMTTHGLGLFSVSTMPTGTQVALTQGHVAVIVVVAMLIAQEASARSHAVRQREAERRDRLRLETLSRLARRLSAAMTPADIGEALGEQVRTEAGASALSLGLVSPDGRRLEWVGASGARPGEPRAGIDLADHTLPGDVVRTGKSVEMFSNNELTVGWPLGAGGEPFGVLQMVWSGRQPLDETQLAYISAVSSMVSQALVRARIYADEHARAAVLHSVAQPVTRVDTVGLEYSALYNPADAAHELGGDWYSVMALPDRRTYLAVGDVIGHGLLSVEDMVQLRSTGNAYAHQGLSTACLLTELNRFAVRQIAGEFATNFVAIFDPDDSSVSYSSAGHLPAILRRAGTGEVLHLSDAQGPMLGPFDDAIYVESTVPVGPGDVLVMYTDGLVEHYDENLREGIAHLEQVVAAWPPAALLDCEALARDVGPAPYTDDLCLLIVRFTGIDE